jgi:hypothetical protein
VPLVTSSHAARGMDLKKTPAGRASFRGRDSS